jgi:hypothetical protein
VAAVIAVTAIDATVTEVTSIFGVRKQPLTS